MSAWMFSLEETSIRVLDQAGAVVFEGDVSLIREPSRRRCGLAPRRRAASPLIPVRSPTGSGTRRRDAVFRSGVRTLACKGRSSMRMKKSD